MKLISGILCLLALLIPGHKANDYCDPKLCAVNVRHVGCGYDGSFGPQCPADATLLIMDENAQDFIIAAHNKKRQLWASGGGNTRVKGCRMATVGWDEELAKLAEINVKQCSLRHDNCANTLRFKYVGQNLFITGYQGSSPPDLAGILDKAVTDWTSEGRYVTAAILAKYPANYNGSAIGHFAMVAQDTNVAVGCAVSRYIVDEFVNFLVACNYATSNFIGYPIYRACNKAAEECQTGSNPDYAALCSIKEQIGFI